MTNRILFYPVSNGDTTLLILKDHTTILVDCKFRAKAEDPEDPSYFDVKQDLLKKVQRKNDAPFLDVFILSHPDKDHCHGFEKHFYRGEPSNYGNVNMKNEEIIIGELWVTSMLFTHDQSGDAHALRNEANRRIKMKREGHIDAEKPGNRIRMVGYDGNEKFQGLVSYVPGDRVVEFNGSKKTDFDMFIHAPFKDSLVTGKAEANRNTTSIVFNARFIIDGQFLNRVLLGGDADHYIWEQILLKSKKHGNEEDLRYNLMLSPHHCSWTYFNNVPYENSKEPKDSSKKILSYKNDGAYIIASSKKISDYDQNPPHHAAKVEYIKALGSKERFLNTSVEPSEKEPKPIEFIIDRGGLKRVLEPDEKKKSDDLSAIASVGLKPWANGI